MIELTRSQTRQLESIGIRWSPDTAQSIVDMVGGIGLPVLRRTVENARRSASEYDCFGLTGVTFCGIYCIGRKVMTIDEFIVYLFTEVLV